MTRKRMIAAGIYFTTMVTSVVVTLYFRLIPLEQMGIRSDTLPIGIVAGVLIQVPMFFLTLITAKRMKKGSEDEKMMSGLMKHARMHATFAVFDAPVAESFWSGIILSSIVVFLQSLGLGIILSSILGILLGTGIHIISHSGPLRPLFGEGAKLEQVYIVMLLNRTAFILTNNLIAPILGHFLFADYILAGWMIARRSKKEQ